MQYEDDPLQDTHAGEQYAEAKRLHRAGNHRAALAILNALDREFPGTKNIQLARAECILKLGQFDSGAAECERVLARHQDARAQRLLDSCQATGPPPIPSSPDPESHLGDATPNAYKPLPAPRSVPRFIYSLGALILLGAFTVTVAWIVARGMTSVPEHAAKPTELEVRRAEARLASRPRPAPPAPDEDPGGIREIPEAEWRETAVIDVPDWQPGIYRQVPIPNTWFEGWNGPRTLDVFIPTEYETKPEELFPTLMISMPRVNPGFLGLENWAESRGVIIVVLNSSSNNFHPTGNREAQVDAFNFLNGRIRWHPQLYFATGVSGGAQMCWIAAANSPEMFAGILMMAHGGYRELPLDPRTRVAYVNGRDDWNADYILEMIGRLKRNGNEVRHRVIPGGHVQAPVPIKTRMLDWLLDSARNDLRMAAEVDAND
jgi:hypothetical protein